MDHPIGKPINFLNFKIPKHRGYTQSPFPQIQINERRHVKLLIYKKRTTESTTSLQNNRLVEDSTDIKVRETCTKLNFIHMTKKVSGRNDNFTRRISCNHPH